MMLTQTISYPSSFRDYGRRPILPITTSSILSQTGIDALEERARHAEQKCDRLLNEVETERAMLRAVIDQMLAGVFVVEAPSGKLVFGNEQVNHILRRPYHPADEAQELFGQIGFHSDGRLHRPEEWPISRSIATGDRIVNEEIAFIRADSTIGYLAVSSAPITCSGGVVRYGVIVISDITERKQIEEALKEAERKYRELVRYAPAAIYGIDFRNRRFTSVNDAMCQILGPSRAELLAMNPFDILDEEGRARFQIRISHWLNGEEPDRNVEYKIRAKDGRIIDVVLDVTFTADENGKPLGATVVAHDITEQKRIEAIRQQAYCQIERNMEQFAILADHVRHPLQVVMARADLVEDEETSTSIRKQVKRINALVKQLDRGWVESRAIREFLRRNDLAGIPD
ncbi:PAS domain-containing protein [Methanoculleus sp.]|uniref:PAS domain-containing protein n=1 Tax=Methanoculleus sp. TaxID=90427 RepID=UPI001BD5F4F7|nr:PAS domain S-box protein [Methanoculleus sp.]